MKFSLFFDLAMVVSGNGIPDHKATEAMMESVKTNPRAGRYFHKAYKDPLEGIPEEDIVDLPKDIEDPAEEKPIGDEIPNPTVDMEDSPKNEEVDPIETPTPSTEDEDEEYAQESTEEEEKEEDATESHMSDEIQEDVAALEDLLNAFSTMEEEEEVEPIPDTPVEEAVGRETPAIPSVFREVEAEDDETPIPLNVSVEVNKETADMKVNKTTYVDKEENKELAKVRKMISDFAMAPTTKKKELANEIYYYVLDHNVDIDLRKYRMIWKLVDKPFIT